MADTRTISRQVTIQCEHLAPIVYNHYPRHQIWLGALQIAGGVIMLITGVVSLFSGSWIETYAYGNQGIGLIVLATLTGAFGISAGRSKTSCQITTNMTLSILTAISSCGMALLMVQAILTAQMREIQGQLLLSIRLGQLSNREEARSLFVVILVVSLLEAVVSIIQSTIACHFSCFCCKKRCCKYDITTTEEILISGTQKEQLLLLLGPCAPAGTELQPTSPIVNCGQEQQQQQLPPPYGNLEV